MNNNSHYLPILSGDPHTLKDQHILINDDILFTIFQFIPSWSILSLIHKVSHQWKRVSKLVPLQLKFSQFNIFNHVMMKFIIPNAIDENINNSTININKNRDGINEFKIVELNLMDMISSHESLPKIYEYLQILSPWLKSLRLPSNLPQDALVEISKIKMLNLESLMIEGCEIDFSNGFELFGNFKLKELRLTEIITVEGFESIAQNENLFGLTNLDMSTSILTSESMEILIVSPIFSNLTCLHMEHNHIDDEILKIFTKCKNISKLRKLNLYANDIENPGLLYISSCEYLCNLTYLDLRGNFFTDTGIGYLANSSYLKNVEYLDISRNDLTCESTFSISNGQYLTKITAIDLTSMGLGDLCISQLGKLKCLKDLTLSNNDLTHESVQLISEQFPNLESLDLGDNTISIGASHLFNNTSLSKLTNLDLSLCKIPIKCIVDLTMSDNMINLKKLFLGWNDIGDEGLMLIASSLYNLTHLFLPNAKISSKGVRYLCDGSLLKLVWLDLAKNLINNDGIQYMAHCDNLPYLEHLYLGKNPITDLGDLLKSKENLPNLKSVSFRKCLISKIVDETVETNQILENLEFIDLTKNCIEKSEIVRLIKVAPIRLEIYHDVLNSSDFP